MLAVLLKHNSLMYTVHVSCYCTHCVYCIGTECSFYSTTACTETWLNLLNTHNTQIHAVYLHSTQCIIIPELHFYKLVRQIFILMVAYKGEWKNSWHKNSANNQRIKGRCFRTIWATCCTYRYNGPRLQAMKTNFTTFERIH